MQHWFALNGGSFQMILLLISLELWSNSAVATGFFPWLSACVCGCPTVGLFQVKLCQVQVAWTERLHHKWEVFWVELPNACSSLKVSAVRGFVVMYHIVSITYGTSRPQGRTYLRGDVCAEGITVKGWPFDMYSSSHDATLWILLLKSVSFYSNGTKITCSLDYVPQDSSQIAVAI